LAQAPERLFACSRATLCCHRHPKAELASRRPPSSMADMNNMWYVGILLEILSTMSGTIGKQLIRLSENMKASNPKVAGFCFKLGLVVNTLFGPLVDMAAYSFAAQSMIAPFGGLDVVWNAMLAPWLLQETLTRRRVFGCGLIVLGTVMAGCFGNHTDSEYTIEYLEETLINTRVAIYFAIFAVWFCFNRFYLMGKPKGSALRGISLGCTAGTIAGNMFCVKAAIECIQRSIHEQDGEIWLHWLPYVLLLGAVFFALTNVVYMTKGLQEYEALFMVTIYEGSMIVSGCVSGAVVLLDLRGLEAWRVGLYALSILIVVAGMCVIFSQERMAKSSLAAGTASIQEPEVPGRRTSMKTLIHELDERSLHASFNTLPPEAFSPVASATSPVPSRDASPIGHRLDSKRGDTGGVCNVMQPRGLEAQLAAACGVQIPTAPEAEDSSAGVDLELCKDPDSAVALGQDPIGGATRPVGLSPPLGTPNSKLNL